MSELRDILARTLAAQGALVEPIDPDGLEICAPAHLQEALPLPEWSRVGFGPILPDQAIRISFESEWAQRLIGLLGERGTHVTFELPPAEAPAAFGDLERELARAFILDNATYRLREMVPARSCYLLLVFHVTSTSDDKREDILHLCINESNGAVANHLTEALVAGLRGGAFSAGPDPIQAELPLAFTGSRARELSERLLPTLIRSRLAPFLAGMERRMSRDLDRLHVYYSALYSEEAARIEDRMRKGGDAAALEGEQMRLQAVEREYDAKVADLDRKYSMNVEVRLTQAVRAHLPVFRADIALLRRKGIRKLHLDWAALAKGFELLPCEACGSTPKTYSVCDDKLHCLCPPCLSACPACAKQFCRACHPEKCPRCGQVWSRGHTP
ncbi:MAG: hypothetical protein ABIG68_10610 [Acidobacteriota bacterium]